MPPFCDKHGKYYVNGRCAECDADAAEFEHRLQVACDTIAMEFFEKSGDICAVSNDIHGVIQRRMEFVNRRSAA